MNSIMLAAAWFVASGSTACTTYEALNIAHRMSIGMLTTGVETIKYSNECTILSEDTPTLPQSVGVYSKAEMISYDGKRKVYFINTRDLRKK